MLITPEIANHVLYHFDEGGYKAGDFTNDLIKLIAKADPENMAKLKLGFDDYVEAVGIAIYTKDGINFLKGVANSITDENQEKWDSDLAASFASFWEESDDKNV